jgi:hypothetical protein
MQWLMILKINISEKGINGVVVYLEKKAPVLVYVGCTCVSAFN